MTCPRCPHCIDAVSIFGSEKILCDLTRSDGFSVRVLNFFCHQLPGKTVLDLTTMTKKDLLRLKNSGPQTVAQVEKFLARQGLSLMVEG